MGDFNLTAEYGFFLERVQFHLDNVDTIEHYGTKGMKWGVRKERDASKEITGLGPSQVVVTTKRGETLTLTKDKLPALTKFIGRHSDKYRNEMNKFASMTIKDSKGKTVGECEVNKVNDDEINLVWLGIKKSQRGNGYATAAMNAAVDFGKQSGVKKLTLEVPGNSPDAEHIYTKLGFKKTGVVEGGDDDPWGGLIHMELNFAERDKIKHGEDFLEHYGVKGMKWGQTKAKNLITKSRGEKLPDSADAGRKKELAVKGKRSTDSLSNKELQDLVTRMNLEQQYKRLKVGERPAVEKFIADTLVGAGKQQLSRVANDAASDQVGNLLKRK